MNGYVCFYKDKRWECHANTLLEARTKAAQHFKARKEYDVTCVLAEKGGEVVMHSGAELP